MSYHIYTTDSIILRNRPSGEGDVLLYILTLDLGLIMASARSARLSLSKLRPALQEYSYGTVSCIKAKRGWKVTNASQKENFFFSYPSHTHRVLAQVASVLLQMIPGEEPHTDIFTTVLSGFQFLKTLPESSLTDFECLLMLRILYHLGYVNRNEDTEIFLSDTCVWNENLLALVGNNKSSYVGIINRALEASQLT